MIQTFPTKNGTGVAIYGDYGDLNALYDTVYHIAESLNEYNEHQKGQYQLLMNFAYEIRKAYSGNRLKEKLTYFSKDESVEYFGFYVVWTDILIFISTLRHNAGYISTGKLHQGIMYLLEFFVEKALFEYDTEGAGNIKEFIGQRICITDKYAFLIYQALHIKFVTEKSGKKRFRNIPDYISKYFSSYSNEYKDMVASLEVSAKKQNCEILDLEFSESPNIKW